MPLNSSGWKSSVLRTKLILPLGLSVTLLCHFGGPVCWMFDVFHIPRKTGAQESLHQCSPFQMRIYWTQFANVVWMQLPKSRTILPEATVSILYLLISDGKFGFLLSQI